MHGAGADTLVFPFQAYVFSYRRRTNLPNVSRGQEEVVKILGRMKVVTMSMISLDNSEKHAMVTSLGQGYSDLG